MDQETFSIGSRHVRRIGFGAMRLPGSGVWGPPADRDAALAVLRRAVALGVDHIDTAQYYGPDVANELIRAALHPYPEGLLIATKVGGLRAVADRHGATPAQVALAWLLAVGPHVLAIPGTSSVAHLEENLAAGELALEPEEIAALQ